jgi:hypothetical protein
MTPKEKATSLVDEFRLILMKSNTDAGEEILCTLLAKECALVAVDEILNWHLEFLFISKESVGHQYWLDVKQEIEKL